MSSSQRRVLVALVAVWAVLLFGGLVIGSGDDPAQRMPLWTRLGSSLALVALAWSGYVFFRGGSAGRYSLLLALGMTCGFVGDVLLADLLPGGDEVLAGIAAFGLCHVFYIAAAVHWSRRAGLTEARARWTALGVWLAIGVLGWYLVVFRGQDPTALHWAALPYALLLASTAGMATGLALQERAFVPFAVGGGLFLVSDLMLAAELFNDVSFRFMGDLIWLTYGVGQMLIVTSSGAARRSGTGPGRDAIPAGAGRDGATQASTAAPPPGRRRHRSSAAP